MAGVMPDALPSSTEPPNVPRWMEHEIFPIIADPVRRGLLRSLARGGAKAATELTSSSGRRLDATLKHLATMRAAGLVTLSPDPADKRRQLYSLAAEVPLRETSGGGREIDFGSFVLRL